MATEPSDHHRPDAGPDPPLDVAHQLAIALGTAQHTASGPAPTGGRTDGRDQAD